MNNEEQRGYNAHLRWEKRRENENECDHEREVHGKSIWWWNGWFNRSDEWRDEMGYTPENGW